MNAWFSNPKDCGWFHGLCCIITLLRRRATGNLRPTNPRKPIGVRGFLQAVVIAMLLSLSVSVQGQFLYTTNDGTLTITGYTGPGGAVLIPDSIDGLPVTRVGDAAFYEGNLTGVTIPGSVTNIGVIAFGACTNLLSVVFSDGLTDISEGAFARCNRLTNVAISATVSHIGNRAFYACTSLHAITVDPLNAFYSGVDGALFNKEQSILIQYPVGNTAEYYTIPGGVITIGTEAFAYCSSLIAITIPESVSSIEDGAFSWCPALYDVTIPDTVTSIGQSAFHFCTGLVNIILPYGLTDIGRETFSGCTNLATISIPYSVTNLGANSFSQCTRLTAVNIPSRVRDVGFGTFSGASGLAEVYFLGDAPEVESFAFEGCTNATIFYLTGTTGWTDPFAGLPTKLWLPFLYTTNDGSITITQYIGPAQEVTIPDSIDGLPVTQITNGAFYENDNLTSVTIPDSVREIGGWVFQGCEVLSKVELGRGLTNIGDLAFERCTRLTNIVIPDSVTKIGSFAFGICIRLAQITIPDNVACIESRSFIGCYNLSSVTVGRSITNIGLEAFDGCDGLRGVYFKTNAPSLGLRAFNGDYSVFMYYLPGTTGWESTFGGRPTALWNPQMQTCDGSFGVRTNRFGFNITGTSNLVIVVEAATNLVNSAWSVVGTNILTDGTSYFSDPQWTNHPTRFYRLRSP